MRNLADEGSSLSVNGIVDEEYDEATEEWVRVGVVTRKLRSVVAAKISAKTFTVAPGSKPPSGYWIGVLAPPGRWGCHDLLTHRALPPVPETHDGGHRIIRQESH